MEKSVLFTVFGDTTNRFLTEKVFLDNTEPIAIVAEENEYSGNIYRNLPVIDRQKFIGDKYAKKCAKFFIGTSDPEKVKEISDFLIGKCQISDKRVFTMAMVKNKLLLNTIVKNMNSPDTQIQNIIVDWSKQMRLNVYGTYDPPESNRYDVYRSKDGFPYVILEGKKMYYPQNWPLVKKGDDGTETISDVIYEQHENSPHLYIDGNFTTADKLEGGVIVDAGVCEGNFALRYADKAKKIYLLEPDEQWREPLRRTFAPFADKVVFCDKFLSRYDSASSVTLDTLTGGEKIDFLKMDIEGAEIDALLGAKRTLQRSDAQMAICSYHRQNDEENIKFLLNAYGYETSTSNGYMFFIHDEGIAHSLDFRRGIVYARRAQ